MNLAFPLLSVIKNNTGEFMKIGILGSGDVGKVLSQGFLKNGFTGKAASARAIEPLCMLWCIPGFLRNDWNHAFKVLKA